MAKLEYTFDLGHILTLIILLVSGAVGYGQLSTDLKYVKDQITELHGLAERVVRLETVLHEAERRQVK